MKLLNQSLKYLSVSLLVIISFWAVIFYFNVLDEIKESVDEGLENYKRQIITRAHTDSTVLSHKSFEEGFFLVVEMAASQALSLKDSYADTLIYMQDADDEAMELEPVRMLTTAFENHGYYYRLVIVNPMVEEDDLIEELLWETVGIYVLLLAGIIVINNVVLQRLWKPFYDFLSQVKQYRLGSTKELPSVETKTKEFMDLQLAVNTLLQHSIETFDQQKQFIGNASHELQTPLAIATNKLELLIEKGNLDNAQAGSIAEVLQLIERLVRVNRSLLLLTKIENRQFLDERQVSVNELINENVNALTEMAEFKNVKISVKELDQLSLHIDTTLANIVISNLLRNAVFHNVEGGTVHIDISKDKVTLCNTGKTSPLDDKRIFTRFYKSNDNQSNTGLGLAIVKAIGDLYSMKISYRFSNGMHCFEVIVK